MSKGFVVAEQAHVVSIFYPINITAAATCDVFSMENWSHASIIITAGAGSATTVTVSEADDFTPSNEATKVFNYAVEATAAGDVLDAALAAAATTGVSTGTATGSIMVIEIDADELADGYPCVIVRFTDPGAGKVVSAVAVLSGGRYQEDITATAIV